MKGKVVYMKGLRINFLLKFVIDNLDYSWPKDACIRLVPTVIFLLEFPLDIWFKEEKKILCESYLDSFEYLCQM